MPRSTRVLIAVMLFLLAGFIAINHIVGGAALGEWLLPLLLFAAGLVLALYPEREAEAPAHEEAAPLAAPEPMPTLAETAAPALPAEPVAEPAAAPAPPAETAAAPPVQEAEPEVRASGKVEPVPEAVIEMHPGTRAEVIDASAAAPAKPDDLTRISGIGRKMQDALRGAGYDSFAKIAQASEDDLRAAIEAAGMRLAPNIETWPEQAKGLME
jgi:predicted flap endonuclease-1-like 5' DNA nuclease